MKVIIVGGGQVGTYLASLLIENNHEVTIIENREKPFDKLKGVVRKAQLLFGSGTDPKLLEQVGIAEADVVAAVTGTDEVNLVVSTLAKMEFGVPRVVARVNNPKNTWLFNSGMGVDVTVNQADILGHLIMEEMDLNEMFTLLKLNQGQYSVVQTKVSADAVSANQQVKDLAIPADTVLIAIIRDHQLIIPKGDTQILADDEILALANENQMAQLNQQFQ